MDVDDRTTLMHLHTSMSGERWNKGEGWGSEERDWQGVDLGPDGRVIGLTLYNSRLDGKLPHEVTTLNAMEKLNISGHRRLFDVFLSHRLTGTVPDFTPCPRLTKLWLHENRLSGPLPPLLFSLPRLQELAVYSNLLTGEITLPPSPNPPSLDIHPPLRVLLLARNQFSGAIPAELPERFRMLEILDISNNTLSAPLPASLGKLSRLHTLRANNNGLAGPIPPELGDCVSLQKLCLHSNALSGEIPDSLHRLTALEVLNLSSNTLSGPLPSSVLALPKLTELRLSGNNLSGTIPSPPTHITLRTLLLQNNAFTGTFPLQLLENAPDLRVVFVEGNCLDNVEEVRNCPKPQSLNLVI